MARYRSYSDRLERRALNLKRFVRFLLILSAFFMVTHFFVRVYKVKDSFSAEIPENSYVVATFYYPLFGNEPKRGDLVMAGSFPSHFWSLAKWGEILSFGLFKANWWGREEINTQRLYKIIASEGDTVRQLDGTRIAIRALGQVGDSVYYLPAGSAPFLDLSPLQERLLSDEEYLGILTGVDAENAIHTFRFLNIDEINTKARTHFNF